MQMHTFRRIDTLMGWGAFLVAAVVYGLTVEPTASLWDCPEFIASGYKLEVGHPPGAPFFMLTANLFSQFAGDASRVALMVNLLSALLSAGCILFLFWTITHFARRLVVADGALTAARVWLVEMCGLVGALAYTFSDTFWFSAVEAEVYAYSSFLTALVFWLMLKWEDEADQAGSDRWMVLIAYLIGLSIGVHLLNLLCIPAMVLVWHFRRSPGGGLWGIVRALLMGAVLVAAVLYGLVPGVVWLAGRMELFCVNTCGMPYQSGVLCFVALLAVGLPVAVMRARKRVVRTSLLCLGMMLLGYSCYGVILIRSCANPPMNENAPDNIFSLRSYLAREQYGDAPLLYGRAYTSQLDYEQKGDYMVARTDQGAPIHRRTTEPGVARYDVVGHKMKYHYAENMLFPRMHDPLHRADYEAWMGGVEKRGNLPTFRENLRYFLSYQVNFMYWRYFLWNFVGRQNDIQGHGEAEHGNWITGIAFVDDLLLGCDTSRMPAELQANPGRNVYFCLPLLLGLFGLYWQAGRGRVGGQQLWILSTLFIMTGLAIVVYLNQYPNQPRERDYAYAGSFYAFAIWIGLGVAGLADACKRLPRRVRLAVPALCLLVPLQMASQTWDDHDRSGRTACRDFGRNYLQSLPDEGNPIILTNGDNDTFPLWYNHDVEGERTDTRVCNMQYAAADWYIDQMKRPAYDSPALPFEWTREQYRSGVRERIPVRPELKKEIEKLYGERPEEMRRMLGDEPFELRNVLRHWVLNDNPEMQCIPTDSVTITSPTGEPRMTLSFAGKDALYKSDLLVLEMLSHADWSRPLYVSVSANLDEVSYLRGHLVLEGLAYRVSPHAKGDEIDVERTYDCVMNRFRYGGLSDEGVYADESVLRMAYGHQRVMARLIDSLLERGDTVRALHVAEKWLTEFPPRNVPPIEYALSPVRALYANGRTDRADVLLADLLRSSDEWLAWMQTFRRRAASEHSVYRHLGRMQRALALARTHNRETLLMSYAQKFMTYAQQFENL